MEEEEKVRDRTLYIQKKEKREGARERQRFWVIPQMSQIT